MAIDTITKVIAETMNLDATNIHADTQLASIGIDSLKAINILFELEEIYDIEVPNEIIAELQTVQDIEDTLTTLMDKK